jgi:hypothetical protein
MTVKFCHTSTFSTVKVVVRQVAQFLKRLPAMRGQQCAQKQQNVYRQRHPEKTPFYSVLFHHFDRFAGQYDLRFEKHYGKWRPVIPRVVQKYLNCGILKNGF